MIFHRHIQLQEDTVKRVNTFKYLYGIDVSGRDRTGSGSPPQRAERLEEREDNLWSDGRQKMNVKILREAVHDSGKIGAGILQKAQ